MIVHYIATVLYLKLSYPCLFIPAYNCLLQSYSAIFEAVIDGLAPNQARGRTLTFEVAGEGNLPRISINKPTVRNKRGQPLLLFKKNLVGRPESLPLILQNDGTLPSKVGTELINVQFTTFIYLDIIQSCCHFQICLPSKFSIVFFSIISL